MIVVTEIETQLFLENLTLNQQIDIKICFFVILHSLYAQMKHFRKASTDK